MKRAAIFIGLILFLNSLFAISFNEEDFLPNSLIVGFAWDAIGNRDCILEHDLNKGVVETGITSFDQLSRQYGFADLKQRIDFVKDPDWNDQGIFPRCIYNITLSENDNIDDALRALKNDPNIIFAEYEPVQHIDYVPNDASYNQQWAHQYIQTEPAWDYITGSEEIIIGIVDSGIKWNHPDLQENIWINEPELNSTSGGNVMTINWTAGTVTGGNGIDDDGNGKIDDCIGWNFFGGQTNQSYQGYEDNDHGTHVAGCAGAVGDNYIGCVGAMMTVKLISSRHSPDYTPSSSIYYGDLGIYYCADSGADVINCSFGGPGGSATYNTAINYAMAQGAIVACAAGNDNLDLAVEPHYPGNATNAVCVAATGPYSDEKAGMSNYGTPVDVSAPGISIYSTIIADNGYASFSGTSMASPIAAGVAGLIKAMHPGLSSTELKNRLEYTCDDIDDLNPGYEGLMGSGRVNAFKGTMYDLIPKLTIAEFMFMEQDGDGDGVANPGETVSLMINLGNDEFWIDAEEITATITCSNTEVTFINDESVFSDIPSGYSGWNSTNPFTFETPAALSDYILPFTITISANPNAAWSYTVEQEVIIELTLAQAGWPYSLGGVTTSAGVIIDLDDDGTNEILFGDQNGMINVMHSDGSAVAPFPLDTGSTIGVAVAAGLIDGDEIEDIVIGNDAGHVIAYDLAGNTIFDYSAGGIIKSNPMIADVDGNGTNEVIICTFPAGAVHIINSDGTSFTNFPASLDSPVLSSPAVGDLNSDGNLEVIVCTISGSLSAISSNTGTNLAGWPYSLGFGSTQGPMIVNVDSDNDPEVIISTTPGIVSVINHDGSLSWNLENGNQIRTAITTADFDNNGSNDICFVDYNGNVHILDSAGNELPNFPTSVGNTVVSTPVIADIDNNGTLDVIFGDDEGYLHSIDLTGNETFMFPIYFHSSLKVAPAIGYADNDNDIEILIPNQSAYYLVDYKDPSGYLHWANFKRNPARTGNAFDPTSGIESESVPVFTSKLGNNYPNPFNPETYISYSVKEPGFVNLKIYNTRGQLVKTLVSESKLEGVHYVTWNGSDNSNKAVSSGIYFYKMDTKNYSSTRKMILLK
ncbi:MAG: S8 family serine peptidase [Candidatus Cloacimonetes bacterium]|nr:S8 family serine peptidase [Candidatus Cloacimonadota bacterium]